MWCLRIVKNNFCYFFAQFCYFIYFSHAEYILIPFFLQVAVIASNFELAEMIQNYKSDDIGEYDLGLIT